MLDTGLHAFILALSLLSSLASNAGQDAPATSAQGLVAIGQSAATTAGTAMATFGSRQAAGHARRLHGVHGHRTHTW